MKRSHEISFSAQFVRSPMWRKVRQLQKGFFVENENKNGYEQTQGQQWRRCSFECNDNNQHNNSNDHNNCDCDSNNNLNGGSSDDFNGYNYTDISNSKISNQNTATRVAQPFSIFFSLQFDYELCNAAFFHLKIPWSRFPFSMVTSTIIKEDRK